MPTGTTESTANLKVALGAVVTPATAATVSQLLKVLQMEPRGPRRNLALIRGYVEPMVYAERDDIRRQQLAKLKAIGPVIGSFDAGHTGARNSQGTTGVIAHRDEIIDYEMSTKPGASFREPELLEELLFRLEIQGIDLCGLSMDANAHNAAIVRARFRVNAMRPEDKKQRVRSVPFIHDVHFCFVFHKSLFELNLYLPIFFNYCGTVL
jgi:hypothetical protein